MKELIINKLNIDEQINKLIEYIIKQNKNIIGFCYNGRTYLEIKKLILPFEKINDNFKLIDLNIDIINDWNFKKEYLINGLLITGIQYIDNNSEYIKIKEINLYPIMGINKKTILIEYHKQQYKDNELLNLYQIKIEKIIKDKIGVKK